MRSWLTNQPDDYKFQFRTIDQASQVKNGVPYWDIVDRCWKVTHPIPKALPYNRPKQKRINRQIIERELDSVATGSD